MRVSEVPVCSEVHVRAPSGRHMLRTTLLALVTLRVMVPFLSSFAFGFGLRVRPFRVHDHVALCVVCVPVMRFRVRGSVVRKWWRTRP